MDVKSSHINNNTCPTLSRTVLYEILCLVLKPILSFCLRHALRIQDFLECAKRVFVEVGKAELTRREEPISSSRLSILTGMHRRDIANYIQDTWKPTTFKDVIMKVIGQWQSDKRFVAKRGIPKSLSYGTEASQFYELVYSVSKDLNPATILFELKRVGAVEETTRGLKLIQRSYTPKKDLRSGFAVLSEDIDYLMSAVHENLIDEKDPPNLHAHTSFDKIRKDALPDIKLWLLKEGHLFHKHLRDYLSQHDQDINPKQDYDGKYSSVHCGAFSIIIDP